MLLSLLPWTRVTADTSPFVLIFHELGDTLVANALNVVVLTAALSVYNSCVLQQPYAVRPCSAGQRAKSAAQRRQTRRAGEYHSRLGHGHCAVRADQLRRLNLLSVC